MRSHRYVVSGLKEQRGEGSKRHNKLELHMFLLNDVLVKKMALLLLLTGHPERVTRSKERR
jgi:hypothetical protein